MIRITSSLLAGLCLSVAPLWLAPGYAEALDVKLFGLNYNARSGPDWAPEAEKCKSAEDIKLDMAALAQVTTTVRLYSLTDCNQGSLVIPAAINAGLNVSVGLWVSADPAVFAAEKAKLQELINPTLGIFSAERIFDIHVGSEAIYRKDVTAEQNIAYMNEIKAVRDSGAYPNAKGIPVTISDIGDTYIQYPELIKAVDVVSANGFPFWEKWPTIETAAAHFKNRMAPLIVRASELNKGVFISETGWASGGVSAKSSEASPDNALRYFKNFYNLANQNGWQYFYFSAFDEAWKTAPGSAAELDTVEAHFGLFYANRTMKANFAALKVRKSGGVFSFEDLNASNAVATGATTTTTTTTGASTTATSTETGAPNGTNGNANGKDKCTSD